MLASRSLPDFSRQIFPKAQSSPISVFSPCLQVPGKRCAPIPNASFQHPPDRGLELVTGPDQVNFALFGFTGDFAAAPHWCDVRLLEHMALYISMAYRRIRGHGKIHALICGRRLLVKFAFFLLAFAGSRANGHHFHFTKA